MQISSVFNKIKFVGKSKTKTILKLIAFILFTKPGANVLIKNFKKILNRSPAEIDPISYNKWIINQLDIERLKNDFNNLYPTLPLRPKFSIIMPVYNPPVEFLKSAIQSVIDQLYDNWELCIADDCSPNATIHVVLDEFIQRDDRIKVLFRTVNGHISACSNSALQIASGEYLLFMDHDDLLTPNCLFEFVRHINENPENKIIYSDEDKVDEGEQFDFPHFKPDWAPDSILSRNYFGHVVVMEKTLVNSINGFREGFEGSQDYDLILRATEETNKIGHIAKVLYHWRIHEDSVAHHSSDPKPYAYIAAKKAIQEALIRRGTNGSVEDVPGALGTYRIRYDVINYKMVSIIIPTMDQVKFLRTTLDSIIFHTTYPSFEIIVINNNSETTEFFELIKDYENNKIIKFKCINAPFPFNFSKLMNLGVAESNGDYILFLNNDVKIFNSDWLREMVSFAQNPHAGVVGVRLLYPNDTIQHAGVVLGLDGPAGHVFVNNYKDENGYYGYIKSLNNYSAVTFACAMIRKSVYLETGGMDENLPVEYNDIDMCIRVYKKGYYNVYVPDVTIYHYESSTRGHPMQSKKGWDLHQKDLLVFTNKWNGTLNKDPFYNPNLSLKNGFGIEFN